MAMRQNDWTLGAVCSRYCSGVTHHHHLEDEGIFPHLRRSDESLGPVLDRLAEEHLEIHDAIEAVDTSLVRHMNEPTDFSGIEQAIEALSEALADALHLRGGTARRAAIQDTASTRGRSELPVSRGSPLGAH